MTVRTFIPRIIPCLLVLLTACSGSNSSNNPAAPTPPTTPGMGPVSYAPIGASDAIGVGSSALCVPFVDCPDGRGYAPEIARRLRSGRQVTLTILGIPGAVLSPDIETLGNSLGRQIPANFLERLGPFVPRDATLVTIFAGGNDVNTIASAVGAGRAGADPSAFITQQVQAFARDYGRLIDVVRNRAPNARVIVMNTPNFAGLPYVATRPASERRILQEIAVRLTVEAINPLSARVPVVDLMCNGRSYDPALYSADGFHPNDAGYQYLSDVLMTAITSGTAPPPPAACGFMTLV